jgi:phosphoglucosamine mutase
LVRESGTEPVIRVMVEAKTQQLCESCADQVVDTLHRQGHAEK